MAVCSLKTKEF